MISARCSLDPLGLAQHVESFAGATGLSKRKGALFHRPNFGRNRRRLRGGWFGSLGGGTGVASEYGVQLRQK